jgi:hypothetical protein
MFNFFLLRFCRRQRLLCLSAAGGSFLLDNSGKFRKLGDCGILTGLHRRKIVVEEEGSDVDGKGKNAEMRLRHRPLTSRDIS